MSTQNNSLTIYTESNPNPNSLKFVANQMLFPQGESFDFPDPESASSAPLAQELFQMPFVKRVFYMNNFITVTKDESVDWGDITNELKQFILEYLSQGKPLFLDSGIKSEEEDNNQPRETPSAEIDEKITSLLDEYIKPAVEMDGGAIQYHSFNDGVVKVLLQGACSGCPSSTLTLKSGIENLLKSMIPEVTSVEAEGI